MILDQTPVFARASDSTPRLLAAVALLTLLLPSAALTQEPERYHLAGDEVAIYNLIGNAKIVRGEGDAVEVDVAVGGPDAAKLEVQSGRIDGRETLRVIYPGDKIVDPTMSKGSRTQIDIADDGTWGDESRADRTITISGKGPGLEAHADLTITVPAGKRVDVHQAAGGISANSVTADLFLDTVSAGVTASDIHGTLNIDVASGSVAASGIEGNVEIDTGSGEIHVEDVRGKRFGLDTGSGRISAGNIDAPSVHVDTGSGAIDLSSITAREVSLDTGSGSVSLALDSDVEMLTVDTGSGAVRLAMPKVAGADLRIETGSGDIDVDAPHEAIRIDDGFFHGRIGDGDGEIIVETGSGNVTIESRQ
jgi:hypothetical protein